MNLVNGGGNHVQVALAWVLSQKTLDSTHCRVIRFCRRKSFSRGLESANFDSLALIASTLT